MLLPHVSQVRCVTGAAVGADALAGTGGAAAAAITLRVRGAAAACVAAGGCAYAYDDARTPRLTAASVSATSASAWSYALSGSGFGLPAESNEAFIGATPCTVTGGSDTALTCTSTPPIAGMQTVSLVAPTGAALPSTTPPPQIAGASLSVSGLSPSATTMAGGAELTISGQGFSASDSVVALCNRTCAITAVDSLSLKCTLPSILAHDSGTHTAVLANASSAVLDLAPPPPAPPGIATGRYAMGEQLLTIQRGRVVALSFPGLGAVPRGATIGAVSLRVVPHSGDHGELVLHVRAALHCAAGGAGGSGGGAGGAGGAGGGVVDPLSPSALAEYNASNATVEWDVQPYSLGFEYDRPLACALTSSRLRSPAPHLRSPTSPSPPLAISRLLPPSLTVPPPSLAFPAGTTRRPTSRRCCARRSRPAPRWTAARSSSR